MLEIEGGKLTEVVKPSIDMDEAAEQAKVEFEALPEEVQTQILVWGAKHFQKCGYKRLGRIVSGRLE